MSDKEMNNHLVRHTAAELVKVLDKVVDANLPDRLAGIVKLHAGLAVGSVLIPIPGADLAASAANVWTMYVRINKEIEVPFSENFLKSVATGVATNIGANAAVVMVLGSAFKFIPGLGSLGGAAVMAATIYGVTIAAGVVYMKAITMMLKSKGSGGTESDLKDAVDEVMSDKNAVKNIFTEAKKDYKPNQSGNAA